MLPENPDPTYPRRKMLPEGLDVLEFRPGHLLRIRLPMTRMERLGTSIGSLAIYLVLAAGAAYLVESIADTSGFAQLVLVVVALALWFRLNRRGTVLLVLFDKQEYTLAYPLGWSKNRGLPKVELRTYSSGSEWICDLHILGRLVTKNLSTAGKADAESPLTPFVDAFRPTTGHPDASISSTNKAPAEPDRISTREVVQTTPSRRGACPLIILVHGTWGAKSPWAMPEQSSLVRGLRNQLTHKVEFRRFEWSGANRSNARAQAAARLSAELKLEIDKFDRQIFVLAHSHGGNVAVRAFEILPEVYRESVRCVLMATPFLTSAHRFHPRDVYNAMPQSLKDNLHGVCMFGFWVGALVAMWAFQVQFVDEASWLPVLGGEVSLIQLPVLVAAFFAPFFLFDWLYKRAEAMLKGFPESTSASQPESVIRHRYCFRIFAYAQDEALLALSVVMNLLALIHQAFFALVLGVSRLSSKARMFDAVWAAPWAVWWGLMLLFLLGVSGTVLLFTLAGVWPALHENLSALQKRIEPVFQGFGIVTDIVVSIMFAVIVVTGLICLVVISSMALIGLVRIGVLSMIGVMDQVRDRDSFLDAVFGGVWVSMIPLGRAESVMLHGRSIFSHVRIYDDERVIAEIAEFVMQQDPAYRDSNSREG